MRELEVEKEEASSRRLKWGGKLTRIVLLLLLLAPFVGLKIMHTPGARNFGLDAAYWYQVARNVAEGEGLVTSVSLYHAALEPLPQRSPMIYPAWPLLLGYTGRVMGMMSAALLLPKLFYLLDLALLYMLSVAVTRSMGGLQRPSLIFPAGTLVVLLFAANEMFFYATAHPYSEGLAFAAAFSAFLCFDQTVRHREMSWALASGFFAGLAFLSRTQMFSVGAGIGLVLLWHAARDRRSLRLLIAAALPLAAMVTWWYLFIFNAPVQRADVAWFQMWVETDTFWEWLTDRMTGFIVGFHAFSSLSYVKLFGPAAYLPPLALASVGLRKLSARSEDSPSQPGSVASALILTGVISFATLNLFHEQFFLPWLFGWRHGLPYLFLILPSIAYFLLPARHRWVRWAVILVVVFSAVLGLKSIVETTGDRQNMSPLPAEVEMFQWLDQNHPGVPTLLTTHAQNLAVFSDANFHWTTCEDSPEQTLEMIERLPIDYVIVYRGEERCPYQSRSKLAGSLEIAQVFGNGQIYLLRPAREDRTVMKFRDLNSGDDE